ncbi:MAG: alpha/beta hydrolase [Aquisalimonadaceae bacterium]
MPYVELNGEDLFYASHDQDGSRNLIGIHGAGGDHGIWPGGMGNLPDCNTWLPDLPGHGRSGGPPRNRIAAYADVIEAFVTSLELDNVILAGHSMGGTIALALALRNPAWLQALILICTGARPKVQPEVRELIRTDFPAAAAHLAATGFSPGAAAALREEHKARVLSVDPAVYMADFDACDSIDVSARLATIPQPALIISGDIDHMTPLKYSQFLEDHLPNARLAVIAPAGHQLPREQPDDMVRIIRGFLLRSSGG